MIYQTSGMPSGGQTAVKPQGSPPGVVERKIPASAPATAIAVDAAPAMGTLRVRVQPSGSMVGDPLLRVASAGKSAAPPVTLKREESGNYIATLSGLPANGDVYIQLLAPGGDNPVPVAMTAVRLAAVNPNGATEARSVNGHFQLTVPANVLPKESRLAIGPSAAPRPSAEIVSGPYRVSASSGNTAAGPMSLHFRLESKEKEQPQAAHGAEPSRHHAPAFEVMQWNETARRWERLESKHIEHTGAPMVTARTGRFGDFVLVRAGTGSGEPRHSDGPGQPRHDPAPRTQGTHPQLHPQPRHDPAPPHQPAATTHEPPKPHAAPGTAHPKPAPHAAPKKGDKH